MRTAVTRQSCNRKLSHTSLSGQICRNVCVITQINSQKYGGNENLIKRINFCDRLREKNVSNDCAV